jgi:hypothetical protein
MSVDIGGRIGWEVMAAVAAAGSGDRPVDSLEEVQRESSREAELLHERAQQAIDRSKELLDRAVGLREQLVVRYGDGGAAVG